MPSQEKPSSLSSDKLLAILECIAESRVPMRLQDLAERVGITQSTVLRYLRTLQNANYVYQEETTLHYALTWKLCKLTENLNSYISLRNIANPFVNRLANTLQMGVCLVVDRDWQCLYLDCIDHPNAAYTPLQYIGKRAPMHATGSGKVLLASYPDAKIEEYISRGLSPCTKYTITEPAQLKETLRQVREQGFASDEEECELGLKCVSYPIRDFTGAVYAAISMFGNADEIDRSEGQVRAALKETAAMISARLGWACPGPDEG